MNMPAWHWIDYVIIGVIGLSIVTGLFRGFVKELIALCVWILAIWLAFAYSQTVAGWLQSYIQDKTVRTAVAFIAILLATLITGGLINAILSFILHRSGLSGTDRLLGMGFGIVRGIFIVALVMLVIKMAAISDIQYRQQSYLYSKFDPIVNWLYGYTPEFIKKMKVLDKNDTSIEKKPAP
jgi:membrane protein required for colicin V production